MVNLRCRLGFHTPKRTQGPVGYCLRGCGDLLDAYGNGRICILYVHDLGDIDLAEIAAPEPGAMKPETRPSDRAIAIAQAAVDRGEMGLLEAIFYAEALSTLDPTDTEEPMKTDPQPPDPEDPEAGLAAATYAVGDACETVHIIADDQSRGNFNEMDGNSLFDLLGAIEEVESCIERWKAAYAESLSHE